MSVDQKDDLTVIGPKKLTLAEVHAKLKGKTGKRYWRSLEELADSDDFHDLLEREFPRQSSEFVDSVSRRSFMKLMSASLALAGVTGCTKQPDEKIFPYVAEPEGLVLGKPVYFASAFPFSTGAIPLLIKTDAFRPIKIDGNPDHPLSKGAFGGGSDPITQATLLDLYDPFRSQDVLFRGSTSTWAEFAAAFSRAMQAKKSAGGQGVYILSSVVTSPTLAAQVKQAQQAFPQMQFLQWDPVNRDSARRASKNEDAQYNLENADVVVSLDADFLGGIHHPGFLPLSRQWARRRKLEIDPQQGISVTTMNRTYVVETCVTNTGMKADHRLALHPADLENFAKALAGGGSANGLTGPAAAFFDALQKDLKASGGRSVVIPGEFAPPSVHAAARQLNESLGNVGKTVTYTQTVNPMPNVCADDITKLAQDMAAGKVEWLIILGANPSYDAPADLKFDTLLRNSMSKVNVVHLGSHLNETSQYALWHIPLSSYLEGWTDARAYDGTVSIVQPMIAPLYNSHSSHEIIQLFLDQPYDSPMTSIRANWPQLKDDAAWRKALHQGWIDGTAFSAGGSSGGNSTGASSAAAASSAQSSGSATTASTPQVTAEDLVVVFRPDPHVYDGRWATVSWLQEVPKPITKLAWDNAALIAIPTAHKLGVDEGDVINVSSNGHIVEAVVSLYYGAAENTITIYLGGGRSHAGPVGTGVGANAYLVRTAAEPNFSKASIMKTGRTWDLCIARSHYTDDRGKLAGGPGPKKDHSLEGDEAEDRSIIRMATLEEFRKEPNFALEGSELRETPTRDETLYYNYRYDIDSKNRPKQAWSMAIDQNSCVGCNACVVACYAENNINVVGRQQAKIGRIMQWIRIDTYFEGDLAAPRAHFQPMLCQHCENAGCEVVCPVAATVHTPEGLNMMVYNRCVGTRYCSNNCPYKVRRFNWLLYSDYDTESYKFMRNPDVTVRSRGVMEKCSYCVQRIEAAKHEADKENRLVRDGEIITACQQACPTNAIIFGDLNDPNSMVSQRKRSTRNYPVLGDLNYRPRTTYIAEVINPNPELQGEVG